MNPAIIIAAIDGAIALINLIVKAKDQAKRTREWTAAESDAVDARWAEAMQTLPHWQPSGRKATRKK